MRVASGMVLERCTTTPLPIEMTCGFLKKCIRQKKKQKKHETRLKSYLSGAPLLWQILDPTLSLLHTHCKRVYGEDQQKVQLNWLNWWVHFKNTSSPVTRVYDLQTNHVIEYSSLKRNSWAHTTNMQTAAIPRKPLWYAWG